MRVVVRTVADATVAAREEEAMAAVATVAEVTEEVATVVVRMEVAMAVEAMAEVASVEVAAAVATHTAPSPQRTAGCVRHPRPRHCTSPQTSCPHIPAQAGRRAALHGSPAHQ